MWAYKLDRARNPLGMTRSAASVRAVLEEQFLLALDAYEKHKQENDGWSDQGDNPFPSDTPIRFDVEVDVAQGMARSLGWDMTIHGEMKCFLVPGPDSFMYGFIITQATSGQRFVISPVPMDYLKEHIDYSAHTSTEEVQKVRAALDGGTFDPPPLTWNGEWKRSRKGNQYCFINGAQVTIFPGREGGYVAVVASPTTDLKVFTRSFSTEQDCAVYVVKHFYDLVREWGVGSGVTLDPRPVNDNPFAGISWDDDEA